MSVDYGVREAPVDDVRDHLIRIWKDNLRAVGEGGEDKFRWFYRNAPDTPDSVFVLMARSAEGEEQPVGSAGVGIRRFFEGARELRTAVLADTAVDAPHRTGLPVMRLIRAVSTALDDRFDLAYGFPNARAEAVFQRCGYHQLGRMPRYVRVLRHAAYLRKANRLVAPLACAAGPALDWTLLGARAAPLARRGRELVWESEVDGEYDRLWERVRGTYGILCRRDARFLQWRFLQHPVRRFRLAALRRRSGRELLAYAMVEPSESGHVHIHDFFGAPDELPVLLERVARRLRADGATSVSLRFLGEPRVLRMIKARGFRARDPRRAIICAVPAGSRCEADAADVDGWFLTDADEDF